MKEEIKKQYRSMTDMQILLFAKNDIMSLTPEALQILKRELHYRNLDPDVLSIGKGTGLQDQKINRENEDLHFNFNSRYLSQALNDTRDGKSREEISIGLQESGLDEIEAMNLISQVEPEAKKLLSNSNTSLFLGVFICLSGMAIHLINPSRLDVNPAGILATCSVVIGIFKMIKAFIDRGKFLNILRLINKSQN